MPRGPSSMASYHGSPISHVTQTARFGHALAPRRIGLSTSAFSEMARVLLEPIQVLLEAMRCGVVLPLVLWRWGGSLAPAWSRELYSFVTAGRTLK